MSIPVLSFFTGGGFLDIGFKQAGFKVVWTNEVNTSFASLYNYGMTSWEHSMKSKVKKEIISNTNSIEKISAANIVQEAFRGKNPRFFGIIGGPPCPDFSVGGKNRGGNGNNGRLSKVYVHRICKISPDFFVFENVAGLYKTRIHREFLEKLEHQLEKNGYCLDLKILNALEMGVPQDRERLIMVGVKQKYATFCLGRDISTSERGWFCWPESTYRGAKKKFLWPRIVLNGNPPCMPKGIPKELMICSILDKQNDPAKKANGRDCFKAYSGKFKTIKEGDTQRKSFKRLHRYRFSPTACYGHNEVHLHPWEPRRLSVREAMRIQGIPDAYELPEDYPLSDKFAIVSNAVPVPLAYAVAKRLRFFFKRKTTKTFVNKLKK